jgi:hypothetical protein
LGERSFGLVLLFSAAGFRGGDAVIGLVVIRRNAGVIAGFAFVAAIRVAPGGQDVAVVGEAVEQRRGELLVAENLDLFAESQVGGDDGGAPFVALRQQVEKQLAAGALKRRLQQFLNESGSFKNTKQCE